MEKQFHAPVLLQESVEYLITDPNGKYLDATIGFGGHSEEFLKNLKGSAKLIGIDQDIDAFNHSKSKFAEDPRVSIFHTRFTDIDIISKIEFIEKFDGIFADLGVSSYQLDEPASGITYRQEAELDLRMNKDFGIPAKKIVNEFDEAELANIIYKYGEEKNSRKIAKLICREREKNRIETTSQLKAILEKSVPKPYQFKTLSRVFQALRIYVNDELDQLKVFLEKSVDLLNKGGRIVIISYHSLEDRIVKEIFRYENLDCICPPGTPVCICDKTQRLKLLKRKPITPSQKEIKSNRRSRSAKLRAAEAV